MRIVVCCKLVPDLVEELELNEEGTDLKWEYLRWVLNEFDDHAVEEALLVKEATGGQVTVVVPDGDGAEDVLYTALAKGADRAIKLVGLGEVVSSRTYAEALARLLPGLGYDLVLSGVQAVDDLDGQVPMLLAGYLRVPYAGVVSGVEVDPGKKVALVRKEFAGGVVAELEVELPAVLGIQAARQPPRYVSVSRVRQAMKESRVEELEVEPVSPPRAAVRALARPQTAGRAEMLEGDVETVVGRIVSILEERGILR